jgi:hypothetical protein
MKINIIEENHYEDVRYEEKLYQYYLLQDDAYVNEVRDENYQKYVYECKHREFIKASYKRKREREEKKQQLN